MSETTDELFDEVETPETPAETPAPEGAPAEATSEAAPAQTEAQPEPAAPAQPATAEMVPLSVLLDERDKRQQAAREVAELRAWRQEQERRRQEAAANVPNVLDDPEGYHAWVQEQFGRMNRGFEQRLSVTLQRERLETSMDRWSEKLGKEEFEKLHAWTATMPPQWVRHAEGQRDPFGFAHREYEKVQKAKQAEELTAKLGGKDLAAFLEEQKQAWLAEQSANATPAEPERQSQPRAANGTHASPSETQRHRPASLSQVNGAAAPTGGDQRSAFDDTFS